MAKRTTKAAATAAKYDPFDIPPFLRRKKGTTPNHATTPSTVIAQAYMPPDTNKARAMRDERFAHIPSNVWSTVPPNVEQVGLELLLRSYAPRIPRAEREPSAPKAPAHDKTDLTHISTIATSLKIDARTARAGLRATKTPKPAGGWWFTSAQIETVKEKLTSWLGNATKSLSPKEKQSTSKNKERKKSSNLSDMPGLKVSISGKTRVSSVTTKKANTSSKVVVSTSKKRLTKSGTSSKKDKRK